MQEPTSQERQIQDTHARLSSVAMDRRGLLTAAGKLAGAGAIAMALTGGQFSSILANHLGSTGPDLEDGNLEGGDPNLEDPTLVETDGHDFDQDGDLTDFDIVQYALFLEHLENAFYRDGLAVFTARDFQRGLRSLRRGSVDMSGTLFVDGQKVRDHVARVGEHEAAHAADLSGALTSLGATPVVECSAYNFDFSSVESFMVTAQLLENTGVAAYVGAASALTIPDLIRVAASIATVEARHAAYFDLLTANRAHPSPYDLARPMVTTIDFVLASGLVGACAQPEGAPQPPFGR